MTYLKEFYMKLKIRQQPGLRSFEHNSRLGGPSPWGGGRENRFPMAKWLRFGGRALANPIPAAPSDPKTRQHPRGGRPQKFSWEDIWIETCRYIHYEGVPSTAAGLMRHLQQWCENQFGEQPADSTLKPKLRKLHAALLQPDEN